ncbi:hypothetical protein SAMN06265365_114131 [Tistlia consotensis]|uniref:Uncharacterized protein n=1 Tax=Tistlia consotensis USBA 355 TaxID=560819 RepID=A0A1Y6BDZ1_9PROT|nr:hypothetical protein [Tistlia consotensis]SME98993.1 hypothetical protein SAMN05428998_102232 [Tistlia consotensis USBA 355]SNR77546.1 hypothetical protein SAMN06265365_114131 [Tistlia consotensis]
MTGLLPLLPPPEGLAEWLGLARVALALAASLAGHVASQRLTRGHVLPYKVSLLAGLAALALVEVLTFSPAGLWLLLGDLLLFCCGWFVFLNFVQAGQSSLRVRILLELQAAGAAGLPHDDLLARYSDRHLTHLRLERMVAGGAVLRRDGRLWLASPSLARLLGLMRALKRLYLGRLSEFDPGRPR